MTAPFVDLYGQYLSIKKDIDNAVESVIKETAFIKGSYVDGFEEGMQIILVQRKLDFLVN